MQLREIMNPRVVTVAPTDQASAAWTRMRRRRIRHLVVMDDERLVGVVSERDLGGRTGTDVRANRTVRSLMTPRVVSATPDTTVQEAAELMRERLIGSLPVTDGDALVGLVTATDVFEALGHEATRSMSRAEQQLLRAPASSKRLGGRPVVRSPTRSRVERPARRERARASNSEKRAPLADQVPRAVKREAGRTAAPLVPTNIRVVGVELDDDNRAYIRRKLGMKLGKFATAIERVSVRVEDVNGPRGGVDKACRIKVVLSGLPSVVFESQHASLEAAIDGAVAGTERAVRRSVQRRRMQSIKGASGGESAATA
jgi:CBS domain-containing protein